MALGLTFTNVASVSLLPRPSAYTQTFTHDYLFTIRKAGRSGRFGDVTWTWFEHTRLWFELP